MPKCLTDCVDSTEFNTELCQNGMRRIMSALLFICACTADVRVIICLAYIDIFFNHAAFCFAIKVPMTFSRVPEPLKRSKMPVL